MLGYAARMTDELAELKKNQREFLNRLAALAAAPLSTLAKDKGLAHTTLTRFANSKDTPENSLNSGTIYLTTKAAIERLTKLFGEKPTVDQKRKFAQEIQDFVDWAERKGFAIRTQLAQLLDGWTDDNKEIELNRVSVIAHIAAGEWREAIEWDAGERYDVWTPELGFSGLRRQGFEVRGNSMNLIYPAGTVLVCVPVVGLNREIRNGERVIVQRVQSNGLYEATCKEYQKDDDGQVWLWPRSSDPLHQTPISPQILGDGIESIEISALVIFAVKREAEE